jgi:hypothetical protein
MSEKYKIIADDSGQTLEMYVNKYIKEGWVPTGGLVKKGTLLYQAITRTDILCIDPDCLDRNTSQSKGE